MNKEFEKKIVLNEITNELNKFTNKDLYQCPYCEETFEWDDMNYNPEESSYTCPKCRVTFDETELQNISILDYIEEIYLTYKGVKNETKFE